MNCPLCKKPTNKEFAPFCSKTCKSRDLLKWINEDYRIPVPDSQAESVDRITDSGLEQEDD